MNRLLLITLITALLYSTTATAQVQHLYQLDKRIRKGDKQALFDLSNYLDSEQTLTESLGYHILQTSEATIAFRLIGENIVFAKGESPLNDSISCESFRAFLNRNANTLQYSGIAGGFLLTPLEKRTAAINFRTISPEKKAVLHNKLDSFLQVDWVIGAEIDTLIIARDPQSLLQIASTLFKVRTRFNEYNFRKNEYIGLLEALTGLEFAVEDENGQMTWQIAEKFASDASFNLLVYWANNYKNFTWDSMQGIFVNNTIQAKPISTEARLFQLLSSEDSATAVNAFRQLVLADPVKVKEVVDGSEEVSARFNYDLPTFPMRFVQTISAYTHYCRQNHIDFEGSPALQNCIQRLISDLSFQQRRHLEDSLAASVSLNDISAIEYWGMINEQSWELTYSAGRILDIFYSKHWQALLNDQQHLTHYLKKSALLDGLGIIGVCNLYLNKFKGTGTNVKELLDNLTSEDSAVIQETTRAKALCLVQLTPFEDTKKANDANFNAKVKDLKKRIHQVKLSRKTPEEKGRDLAHLLEKISYAQIGTALEEIQYIYLEEYSRKYDFMKYDFGFPDHWNFWLKETRDQFLSQYKKMNEYDLYAYHLDQLGIPYKNADGSLDYDSIFELLKYNVVTAFVGGGGGKDNNEVYLLIKLLELTHKTTLGYPAKLCNSGTIYVCHADDRAKTWMQYLQDKQLLKKEHHEPISFTGN